jgi:hypothetical protein
MLTLIVITIVITVVIKIISKICKDYYRNHNTIKCIQWRETIAMHVILEVAKIMPS